MKFFKGTRDQQFSKAQIVSGYLKLSENDVFMQQLYDWQNFNQEAVLQLLALNKDRRDIEKAKMLGKLQVISAILEKIEHAKDTKAISYER